MAVELGNAKKHVERKTKSRERKEERKEGMSLGRLSRFKAIVLSLAPCACGLAFDRIAPWG
jgi:hypothetical protein